MPKDSAANIFTPLAQQALGLALREAARLNHGFVVVEHLLLGLIGVHEHGTSVVLGKMGVNGESVRAEMEKKLIKGPAQKTPGSIPYGLRVKKVLALAVKEAKALNHNYVGTEHILLGILREGDSGAAQVLKNLKIDIEKTRSEILKLPEPNHPPGDKGKPV